VELAAVAAPAVRVVEELEWALVVAASVGQALARLPGLTAALLV